MQMQQATANRMWVDQVQSRVLQRSSLVTNVVTRFNMLAERNTRSARRSRLRIFSEIALDFSFSQIRELPLVLPLLPNRLLPWRYANGCITKHAVIRGLSLPEVWDLKSHTSKKQQWPLIWYPSCFATSPTTDVRVQQLVCGSKTVVVLSTGQTLEVPSVACKMLRAHLWSEYVQKHTVDGKYGGQLKKENSWRYYSLTQSHNSFRTHSFNYPPTRL